MYKPGIRICDLCQQTELPQTDDTELSPPVFVLLPIPEPERFELAKEIAQMIPEPIRAIAPIAGSVPTHYRLEFCTGCTDGFMPMLDDLRRKGFASVISDARRRVARARKEHWKADATNEDA